MIEKPTLVIGDCHGNHALLNKLLQQEGIVNEAGSRIDIKTMIIQLGDLGDFRQNTQAEAELFAWADHVIDIFLWGNHERPVFDRTLPFGGYWTPDPATRLIMGRWIEEGRLKLAHASHGLLITHAGLHPNITKATRKRVPRTLADWLNNWDKRYLTEDVDPHDLEFSKFVTILNSIGYDRGGWHEFGGVLWRDAREKLWGGVRQVFGHSSHPHACQFDTHAGISYCIDTSKHGGIAAIWLPDERIVEVTNDLDEVLQSLGRDAQ